MAKTKDLESWGRTTARKRYAAGGEVDDTEINIEEQAPANRSDEIDSFISEVMRDQIKKMRDG